MNNYIAVRCGICCDISNNIISITDYVIEENPRLCKPVRVILVMLMPLIVGAFGSIVDDAVWLLTIIPYAVVTKTIKGPPHSIKNNIWCIDEYCKTWTAYCSETWECIPIKLDYTGTRNIWYTQIEIVFPGLADYPITRDIVIKNIIYRNCWLRGGSTRVS